MENKRSFAIVIVCYNRLPGVIRLIKSLEKVDYDNREDIELIFSIDNSGSSLVEDYAKNYNWKYGKKIVRTFKKRQGLKKHILQCGDYTKQYDIVVVLEDDIYVSNSMYHYAYNAANYYKNDNNIAGISLYSFQKNWLKWLLRFEPQRTKYDSYFMKIAMSWGQVWTEQKWNNFKNWLEKNSEFKKSDKLPEVLNKWPETSWLKYHDLYCIENNKYFVYPYTSISTNFSDIGEHARYTINDHQVELMYGKKEYFFSKFNEDAVIYDEFMERENLGRIIGIEDFELTVDLWGNKPKKYYKKYVLSLENLPYKKLNSYSLSLRPIELSIINNLNGNEIFLYNTSILDKVEQSNRNIDFIRYKYSLRTNDYRSILKFSIQLYKQIIPDIIRKIKNIIKK